MTVPPPTGTDTGTAPTTPTAPATPSTPDTSNQKTLPELTIDQATGSAVTQLGLTSRDQHIETGVPNIDMSLSRAVEGVDADYSVSLKSGSFKQDKFFADLVLTPSRAKFKGETHQVGAYSLKQYKAYASTNPTNVVEGFGVMLPVLSASGFQAAGIANWLYVGPLQLGYYSGRQIAKGSFVYGKPAPAAAVASMGSAVYSGYAQAGEVNKRYVDDFSEFTWTTEVEVDKATQKIRITIKTIPLYFFNSIYADDTRGSPSLIALDSQPQTSFECITSTVSEGNAFECTLPESAGPQGKIKGRFFGENGQEVAGTFAIKMSSIPELFLGGTLVGGFVAKR